MDYEDIGEFLIEVLETTDEVSPFGRYGKRLFSKYQNKSNLKQNTRYYAIKLLSLANDDPDEIAEIVLNCCVFSMAIMQEKNGQFGFIHHYIRDYFAAVKCINDLRMAVYLADNYVKGKTLTAKQVAKAKWGSSDYNKELETSYLSSSGYTYVSSYSGASLSFKRAGCKTW